tara:strand:- start:15304 stop:19893 length:4590 start_codon:yes stop_codon:yes gene_type:complete
MAFRQIKSGALANQAVINTKLDTSAIDAQSSITGVESLDTFLVFDNDTQALKKVSAAGLAGSYSTADIAEAAGSLYFTDVRAQDAVATNIATAVSAETVRATAAEVANAASVSAETSARAAADTALQSALNTEATRASARETAIESASNAAESALSIRIDNVLNNVDSEALNSLAEIVVAFEDADNALAASVISNSAAISNEVTRAIGVESINAAAIASETTARQGADTTLTTNLTAEAASRTAADTALDSRVTAAESDIDLLESGLAAEIATTNGEVLALQTSVSDEVARAGAAEVANASGLAAEITARGVAVAAARSDLTNSLAAGDASTLAAAKVHDDLLIGDASVDGTAGNKVADRISTGDAASVSTASADATSKVAAEAALRTSADTSLQSQINSNNTDISSLQGADTTEATARAAADAGLQSQISNIISNTDSAALDSLTEIVTAFQAADTQMGALISSNTIAVSTEATSRSGADTTLQTNINTEAASRSAADSTLTSGLAAELIARADADVAVAAAAATDASTKADAGQAAAIAHANSKDALLIGDASVDGSSGNTLTARIATAVQTEATARASADTAEASTRSSADTALSLRATSLEGDVGQAQDDIIDNASDISTETVARTSADSTLQANITAEAVSRAAADVVLTDAVTAEATARSSADSVLTASVLDEVTRASGVEAGLRTDVNTNTGNISINAGAITSEAAAARAAESALATSISDEATLRTNADAAIQSDLDVVEGRVDAILNGSSAQLDTIVEIVAAFEDADSDIQGIITSNSTRLTTNESDIATLISELDTSEAAAVTLTTRVTAAEAAAVTLAGRTTTSETDVIALENKQGSADLDTIASTVSGAVNELHTDTNAVGVRVASAEASIVSNASAISGETTRAQAEESSIRGDFAAADTSIRSDFAAADAVVLSSASSDATAKANTAEVNAKVYADGLTTTEATAREAADDSLEGQVTAEATARAQADNALDSRTVVLETEVTSTQTGAGLSASGAYNSRTGSNYLNSATSLKDESTKLDAALKAEETARISGDNTLTSNLNSEIASRTASGVSLQSQLTAEVARAGAAEVANASNVTANAAALVSEAALARSEEVRIEAKVDFITSNVDAAALDSLTEIVAAFGDADSDLTGLISSNQTSIATNASGLAAELVARAAAVSSEATARTAADSSLQSNIDLKIAKSGDAMTGVLSMGSNKVTLLASGTVASDAVNKGQVDTSLAAQHISQFDTADLAEGTALFHTAARAQAAISVNDVEGAGKVSYSNGVVSVDTSNTVLDMTDIDESTYTGKAQYLMQIKADESGWDFIHPEELAFITPNRQVIDGDGVQTVFAVEFTVNIADAMVFVGGVIQDPGTHYSYDGSSQQITFTQAIPNGSQAVIISHAVGATRTIDAGSVTHESLAQNVKAYVQGTEVVVGTVEVAVSSFPKALYRSAKYIVSVENAAGTEFETRECLVVHDGANAYITEYGLIYTGAAPLGDTDVTVNSGTNDIDLTYTAVESGTKVTITSTHVDA